MQIGKTIAELRGAANLSQQALADLLFVSRDLVSKWENGTRRPEYRTVERIADVFGVPVETLVDKNDLIFRELSECIPRGAALPDGKLDETVNSFLKGLPEKTAGIFLKRYYSLLSTSEIALLYSIRQNHVRSILSKTRKKLKKYVEERIP